MVMFIRCEKMKQAVNVGERHLQTRLLKQLKNWKLAGTL